MGREFLQPEGAAHNCCSHGSGARGVVNRPHRLPLWQPEPLETAILADTRGTAAAGSAGWRTGGA